MACDGLPIEHFQMSSDLQRDFAEYFNESQETQPRED